MQRAAAWTAIAIAAMAVAWLPGPNSALPAQERVFRLEAEDFAFSPAVLHAQSGDRVTIELVSRDYVHGWYLDGYDLDLKADPGQTARLTFVADRAGTYRFRCSVSCGALHPFMIGKLTVGPSLLWLRGVGLALLAGLAGLLLVRR
jgi:heme/copper-type cytochrome/quinol oxidase subunit 2